MKLAAFSIIFTLLWLPNEKFLTKFWILWVSSELKMPPCRQSLYAQAAIVLTSSTLILVSVHRLFLPQRFSVDGTTALFSVAFSSKTLFHLRHLKDFKTLKTLPPRKDRSVPGFLQNQWSSGSLVRSPNCWSLHQPPRLFNFSNFH